jgi:hypothetical protein
VSALGSGEAPQAVVSSSAASPIADTNRSRRGRRRWSVERGRGVVAVGFT